MKIISLAFQDGEMIPQIYTCEGEETSPPLEISGVPKNAASLALMVRDPDASSGDFVHWLLWNLDPMTKDIDEGELPKGALQGTNDAGKVGWSGPCPPSGTHHYEFRLYALSSPLDLKYSADKNAFRTEIKGKILEEVKLTGLYQKSS